MVTILPTTNYSDKYLELNNGHKIPIIGLGTWQSEPEKTKNAVISAVKNGYRHLDCAVLYKNEVQVGEALQELFDSKVVKREDLFITSKLWNTHHNCVKESVQKTLKDLRIDFLDLYLIHWPVALQFTGINLDKTDGWEKANDPDSNVNVQLDNTSLQQTWKQMEELVDLGLVKSIGVSNFNVQLLLDLLTYAIIKPAVNQVENHPYLNQADLIESVYRLAGIITTAYSPLGGKRDDNDHSPRDDPIVKQLAEKYGKSTSQILLRWNMQRGVVVIPKSVHDDRIKQNLNVFDFELTEEDMGKVNKLNKNHRFVTAKEELCFSIFA